MMKKGRMEILFVILVLSAIFAMIVYSATEGSFRIHSRQNEKPAAFSQTELRFAAQKKVITLEVDERLEYFEKGFLTDYLNSIFKDSGLKADLKESGEKTDASLVVMNERLREQRKAFTAPLFQIKGSIFLCSDLSSEKKSLQGVCVKGQFSEKEEELLSYDGKAIKLRKVGSVKEAVDLAERADLDCILGDQTAISSALTKNGIEDQFKNMDADFYTQNVCIMTQTAESYLYSVLNKCIRSVDRRLLMVQAQEKWFGISEPLVEEDRYQDAAILLVIVFAAVFCTFFAYYQSNKRLYNELTDRMEQLTASKQEMQTTFNGVSYYMAELSPEGVIMDINRAFLGYVNKACMGKDISEVLELPDELKDVLDTMLVRTRKTGKGTSREVMLKRHILEVNIFPIQGQKGEVEKLLFMASDVTGVRMAERQMLQDNKMIAVGQLAAGVAHEIRNPLGVIRNYCYVLKNMKDEDAQAQAVQAIEKSVDTAGNIIDNLLNFSRNSSKTAEEVYIKAHIDSVLSLNKGLTKKKQIHTTVLCDEDFAVKMAAESFDMIFINLVSNAIDAMEADGELVIHIYRMEEEFCVEVMDTGTGIEEEILEEIFNPFFTTKSTNEGNGLGLYIVYNEVRKMNGKIEVKSKVGKGTVFRVILPIRMEEVNEQREL